MRPFGKKMFDSKYGERSQMKSPRKILALTAVALLAVPSFGGPRQASASSQQSTQQGTQQGGAQQRSQAPPIVSRTFEVIVPVTVKDANGDLVATLRPDEFRILDDNVEQRITHITLDPVPMSAVILLDDQLKDPKREKNLQDSLRAISAGFGPADEAAIFRFDQFPQQLSDFMSDPDQILTALERVRVNETQQQTVDPSGVAPPAPPMAGGSGVTWSPQPGGLTIMGNGTKCINDAVFAAAELLKTRSQDRRKIIFLVSDGVDSKGNKHSTEQTKDMLMSANAAVYSIGIGVPTQDRMYSNILVRLAKDSGGDTFYASSREDLERIYSRVADEARNRYLLYYSPDHHDHVVTYHKIEVLVRLPGLDVRARDGYYSTPQP
jgi:VWFA-related protein